jgi:hypothetical protein
MLLLVLLERRCSCGYQMQWYTGRIDPKECRVPERCPLGTKSEELFERESNIQVTG